MADGPEIKTRIRVSGDEGIRGIFRRIRDESRSTTEAVGKSARRASDEASAAVRSSQSLMSRVGATVALNSTHISGALGKVSEAATIVSSRIADIGQASGVAGVVAGVGIAGVVAAIASLVHGNRETIDSFADLSDATGMAVENLSVWATAARLNTGTTEGMVSSLNSAVTAYNKAKERTTGRDAKLFMGLGIDLKDGEGGFKSFEDVFGEALDALRSIDDDSRQARAAFRLFGESYNDVLDIIKEGDLGETMESRLAEAASYGTYYTDQTIKDRDRLSREIGRTDEKLMRINNQLTASFSDIFGHQNPVKKFIADNEKSIVSFVQKAGTLIAKFKADTTTLSTGARDKFNFSPLEKLKPAADYMRRVYADIAGAMSGKSKLGAQVPWLAPLGRAANSVAGIFKETWKSIEGFGKSAMNLLPSIDSVMKRVDASTRSFLAGFKGGGTDANSAFERIGAGAKTAITAVNGFFSDLTHGQGVVGEFGKSAAATIKDAFAAIRGEIVNGTIDPSNMFANLNPTIDSLKSRFESLKETIAATFSGGDGMSLEDAGARARTIIHEIGEAVLKYADIGVMAIVIYRTFYGILRPVFALVAAFLTRITGHEVDAWTVAIGAAALKFTGLDKVLGGVVKTVLALGRGLMLLGPALAGPAMEMLALGGRLAIAAAGILAAFVGIPPAVVAAAIAAAAALGTAIYVYWDDIIAGGQAVVGIVVRFFEDIPAKAGKAFDAAVSFFKYLPENIGKFLSELPGRTKSAWEQFKDDAWAAVEAVKKFFYDLPGDIADAVASIPSRVKGSLSGAGHAIRDWARGLSSYEPDMSRLPDVAPTTLDGTILPEHMAAHTTAFTRMGFDFNPDLFARAGESIWPSAFQSDSRLALDPSRLATAGASIRESAFLTDSRFALDPIARRDESPAGGNTVVLDFGQFGQVDGLAASDGQLQELLDKYSEMRAAMRARPMRGTY